MNSEEKIAYLMKVFKENGDEKQAQKMSAYMRNLFPFYGIDCPKRKRILEPFYQMIKKENRIDWKFLNSCYAVKYREFHYVVCGCLSLKKKLLVYEDIQVIKKFLVTNSWWDTVDSLTPIIGFLSLKDPKVNDLMLQWSNDDNFWLRRVAILFQVIKKEKTDKELLSRIILNNIGSHEFFINKAIGWALRDYSKHNPDWVKRFIVENAYRLDKLSLKEGSKYCDKKEMEKADNGFKES